MSAEIKKATGREVRLVGGGGGIFEIRENGEVLWEKVKSGVFPGEGEAASLFAQ